MKPWVKRSLFLFNLVVLIWIVWLALVDLAVLPGRAATFELLGRWAIYESTALLAIMVNLALIIIGLISRR